MVRYTDTTIMPFGMHKGKALVNVPASYLLFLYYGDLREGALYDYIKMNLDVLMEQEKREKIQKKFERR